MKCRFLLCAMIDLLMIGDMTRAGAQVSSDGKLFFDKKVFYDHLDRMTEKSAPENDTFELQLWQDGLNQRVVAPDTEVEVKVDVKIPKTGELLKDAGRLVGARAGCVATYKEGKISVALKKPQIFVDLKGASAATWRYEISAELKKSGAEAAQANGVLARTGKICVSTFGIRSKRTGDAWKPAENPDYKYSIEVKPEEEWKTLGRLDKDAAFDKSGDGMARFYWNDGTEGKSISVRWKIESDYTVPEDTEWTTLTNPCCPTGVIDEKASKTSVAHTQQATESAPPAKALAAGEIIRKFFYESGNGSFPFFKVNPAIDHEDKANVRSSPTLREQNVIAQFPQGLAVQQIGKEVLGPEGVTWVPIRYISPDGSQEWKGYLAKRILEPR